MAEELKKEFKVEAKLVPGTGGVFDVVVDGKVVFSKFEVGRFPGPGEVTGKITSCSGKGAYPSTSASKMWKSLGNGRS